MGSGTSSGKATLEANRPTVLDVNDPENGATSQDFRSFQKMTDDQKAKVITDALKEELPAFLPDNALQKVTYAFNGSDKPQIVSDSELNNVPGIDIYRQVAGVHLSKFKVNYSSADIVNEMIYGDHTQYSGDYSSAYGRALYFGASYSEIRTTYGTSATNRSGGRDSTMIRAKISPKAKGMTVTALNNAVSREISSGSKLGRALSKCDAKSRGAVYALAKGIDYTHDGNHDYHMIYNRGCLMISSKTKHNTTDSRW